MATGDYQSTQAAVNASPTPSTLLDHGAFGGKARVLEIDYTLTTSEAATEVLDLCELIPGDRVSVALSRVYLPNPGTALVFDIGDDDEAGADPDRYVDGLTASAGGWFDFSAGGTASAAAATPYVVQNPCRLQLTFATATTLNAVKLSFTVVIANNS
jgi:hypothetical protein